MKALLLRPMVVSSDESPLKPEKSLAPKSLGAPIYSPFRVLFFPTSWAAKGFWPFETPLGTGCALIFLYGFLLMFRSGSLINPETLTFLTLREERFEPESSCF